MPPTFHRSHAHASGHAHAPADFSLAFAIGIGLNTAFVIVEFAYGLMTRTECTDWYRERNCTMSGTTQLATVAALLATVFFGVSLGALSSVAPMKIITIFQPASPVIQESIANHSRDYVR